MSDSKDKYLFTAIPKETAHHFSSIPWCKTILDDRSLAPFLSDSRDLKKHTGDTFTAVTLQTPDTIPYLQCLYSAPSPSRPLGEIISLMTFGTHVNGHVDTAHGGFIGVLLDDMIGCATESVRANDQTTMTAYLHLTYKKPIKTPGSVLGRAWVDKTEGKKIFGKASIEDGAGTVLATGDALFILIDGFKPRGKL